ncbi:MAG TPA: sensor histidine kinase KdpD [Burkholderiales bacterium]|nr:sensor histidine kinase KdpD [Burkholderiales bacterium]
MANDRPDPDQLLARVQREERTETRGKLRIFFGACAGVGKTYAMLVATREQRSEGVDVVVGLVETHGRKETAALLEGLTVLPRKSIPYRGVELGELDLDAALARKPRLIVVDELAHTNAPGSRHAKRWQDVAELLDAGIDVYTAMNVQHLESLNDVVGKITGIRVWETVPDKVFDEAHEVELVDLPPDELIERLNEGKVYMPEAAAGALQNFFRKGNLIALRELALRRTAERVDRQMREYRTDEGIETPWPVAERIVVCVGPGANAERVVRAGARLAARMKADWTAVYVETPRLQRQPDAERDRILRNLRLAEQLGGIAVTLGGGNVAEEILAYARASNATRIVVGRARRDGLRAWLPLSAADRIVAGASDLEVQVIGGETEDTASAPAKALLARSRDYLEVKVRGRQRWPRYVWAAVAVAIATGIAALTDPFFEPANQVMIYLLAVTLVAVRLGRGPSVFAAVASVVAFDFFYVAPRWSFAISDTQYLLTFAVMLAVGLIISNLTANIRTRARIAGYREQRTTALYAMSRELAAADDTEDMLRIAVKHIAQVFESQAVILLPDRDGRIHYPRGASTDASLHGADLSVAQWVFDHDEPAGLGTDTLPAAQAHYLRLAGSQGPIGVLAVLPASPRRLFVPEQQRLLETFASQIALALERSQLGAAAKQSELSAESERLRNALLAAISHDLRTPLASIVGASSSLLERGERMDPPGRHELARAIHEEAQRMSGLIDNVLDMARLQSGAANLNRQWHPLEELVGATLKRLETTLAGHRVQTHIPGDLPLVNVDGVLIGQVLANLLENAAKYTPRGTTIAISAEVGHDELVVSVADEGPGLPAGEEERIFDKFHRAAPEGPQSGVGLGLSICKAIVQAHGGTIAAENLPAGGAVFRFTLPLVGSPPEMAGDPGLRRAA